MALTPEDVVNKRFQSTKFREGYDQDEVDDFLDEIVVELRRLNQENEELRQRLVAADARIAEAQRSAASAPAPASAPAVASAPAAPEPVAAPVAAAPAVQETQSQADIESTNTANLLQLARRLHEEHVREGMQKRDELIAEGQAEADRVLSESRAEAERLVTEAEGQQRAVVDSLAAEKATLEQQVEQLRTFEREYRQQLRSYIESQLADLDGSSQPQGGSTPSGSVEQPAHHDDQPAWGQQPAEQPYGSAPGSAPAFGQPGSAPTFGQPGSAPGSAPAYPGQQNPQYPGYGN